MTAAVSLPLRVGARTVARVHRRLVRVPIGLSQALEADLPSLPPLGEGADGYLVTSLPESLLPELAARCPDLKIFVRQRYRRSFASLTVSFDDYLAGFSAKSRSTLKRKLRRFASACGGRIDLRCYSSAEDVEAFYGFARTVSARSYQERRLGIGLPTGEEALARMHALAASDRMRGWILFLDGAPVSYLYAPAEGDTLLYAHLGYDPDHADLSPGTVLQFEAMRQLMEEGRFRLFDFTEGEGQHKRQFSTGSVACADLLLMRPTLHNLLAGHLLNGFDGGVALARRVAGALRLESLARRATR